MNFIRFFFFVFRGEAAKQHDKDGSNHMGVFYAYFDI